MTPVEVSSQLVDALRLDLIGAGEVRDAAGETVGTLDEVLPQLPGTWYLTGFLVPIDAGESQRVDETAVEEVDEQTKVHGLDDDVTPDEYRDQGFAFQAQLEIRSEHSFVARMNLRSLESDEWDERVADLQYHDACEFAVGHKHRYRGLLQRRRLQHSAHRLDAAGRS